MKYVEAGTFDNLEESARRIANPETEEDRTNRVLRVVRGPQWDFLSTLVSLPGNQFYDHPQNFKTPVVHEIPKPPPPNYDQPNADQLAA